MRSCIRCKYYADCKASVIGKCRYERGYREGYIDGFDYALEQLGNRIKMPPEGKTITLPKWNPPTERK